MTQKKSTHFSGLAAAAGTGLAIGLGLVCLGSGRPRRKPAPAKTPARDNTLLREPIPARLDRVEARLRAVESRPDSSAQSGVLTELNLRVQQQAKDTESLQVQMRENREKAAADAALIEGRLAEVAAKEDPARLQSMLDTALSLRAEDLRVRLQGEMLESVEATLTGFERTIDDRVSSRVSPIEQSLRSQSEAIADLSRREIESDAHLQRLISAVERLCERADLLSAAPVRAKQPSFLDLPVESHLAQ
jgi:uncharacterized coiled-coil protein SlyX